MRDELLGGRYRLGRQLGEGGMGQVWEAQDETLGRPVAVKVISLLAGGGSRGEEARARFLREARITARLQHPNIVTIHDLGETEMEGNRVPFLVMELVRGEGLDVKLRRGAVAPQDAARWGAQISDALAEAHGAGVMHRDIKPSNILVTPSDIVKVLDFGVARAADPYATADRLTQTGFIVGTPPYMAPEQARGVPETRSDLYALGCLLFELITGRLPFRAPDTVGYLSAHLTDEPPAPSTVLPGLPAGWDELVLTLLRKDPDQRYRSADDLARALRQRTETAGQQPPPGGFTPPPTRVVTTPLPPMEPTAQARRAVIAAIRLALLCLPGLLYMVFLTFGYLQDPSAPARVIDANLALGIGESIMLVTGAVLLFRHRTAGRWLLVTGCGLAALHGLSVSVQYQVVGGPPDVQMFATLIGPLTAVAGIAALVVAVRPAVGQWCRQPVSPGLGAGSGVPTPQPRAGTATVATAVACLLTTPVLPSVIADIRYSHSETAQMTSFGIQVAVFTVGLLLLLGRRAVGQWLVMVGGTGLALQAIALMRVSETTSPIGQNLLPLAAVTSAASAVLAVFPPSGGRSQEP